MELSHNGIEYDVDRRKATMQLLTFCRRHGWNLHWMEQGGQLLDEITATFETAKMTKVKMIHQTTSWNSERVNDLLIALDPRCRCHHHWVNICPLHLCLQRRTYMLAALPFQNQLHSPVETRLSWSKRFVKPFTVKSSLTHKVLHCVLLLKENNWNLLFGRHRIYLARWISVLVSAKITDATTVMQILLTFFFWWVLLGCNS